MFSLVPVFLAWEVGVAATTAPSAAEVSAKNPKPPITARSDDAQASDDIRRLDGRLITAEPKNLPTAGRPTGSDKRQEVEHGRRVVQLQGDWLQVVDRQTGKSGRKWPVVGQPAAPPLWSHDGRFVAYAGFHCGRGAILGVLDVENDLLFRVGGGQFAAPQWSPDNAELAVIVRRNGHDESWSFKTRAITSSQALAPACDCGEPAHATELIGPWHCARGDLFPIDLSRHYTGPKRGTGDENLLDLPAGERVLAGIQFQIGDGIIQLAGPPAPKMPSEVDGISVHRQAVRLFILHATQNGQKTHGVSEGELIAEYRVHYADGESATIPVRIGEEVRDWWTLKYEPLRRSQVGWVGTNKQIARSNGYLRLYLSTWENPNPEKCLKSIDYVALKTKAAPFCVAITAEEPRSIKEDASASPQRSTVSRN